MSLIYGFAVCSVARAVVVHSASALREIGRVLVAPNAIRLTLSVGSMIAVYRLLCCALRHYYQSSHKHKHSRTARGRTRNLTSERSSDSESDELESELEDQSCATEPASIPFIAGAIAGLALLIDTDPDRRTTITLYTFARACKCLFWFRVLLFVTAFVSVLISVDGRSDFCLCW
jgi:hypothetical protein